VPRFDDFDYSVVGGGATAFTLTGPSAGPAGAASSDFTVTPTGGTYTGTFTPTAIAGCTFAPASLSWSGANDAKTFTVTKSAAGAVAVNGTASPVLTPPADVSYTAKTTSTRTYTVDGGTPGVTTAYTVNNLDGTTWSARTTAGVVDQGGGSYSVAGVVIPADFSGVILWDQAAGAYTASDPLDNRPAESGGGAAGLVNAGLVW
jgi:hypothetical protein